MWPEQCRSKSKRTWVTVSSHLTSGEMTKQSYRIYQIDSQASAAWIMHLAMVPCERSIPNQLSISSCRWKGKSITVIGSHTLSEQGRCCNPIRNNWWSSRRYFSNISTIGILSRTMVLDNLDDYGFVNQVLHNFFSYYLKSSLIWSTLFLFP